MTAHFNQTQLPAITATADQPQTGECGGNPPLLASYRSNFPRRECLVQDCAFNYWTSGHYRSTHFLRGDKYMCQFEGCGRDFKRFGDLGRHEKTTHLADAPRYDCPEIGCQYKGSMGFVRRDKLTDHRRNRHGLAAAPRANGRKAQKSAAVASTAAPASTAGSSTAGSSMAGSI